MELMIEHLGHGLWLSLLLSLPCVITAAGIGLIVGILQAVTQVQEQTIAAAPKILGVFAILLVGGGLMMTMLTDYTRESIQIAFNEIPQDGVFILPPKSQVAPGQARAREFFKIQSTNKNPSEKLKEYTAQWNLPSQTGGSGTAVLHTNNRKPGGALGTAEKMALQKERNNR